MQKEKSEKRPATNILLRGLLFLGIVCFCIAAFLSYELANRIHKTRFPIPREANISQIGRWMTIRYISHTYHVPEEVFIHKLSLTPSQMRNASIEKIAKQKNIESDILITEIKHILLEFSPSRSSPPIQTN
jgi:hypothetical protein